MLKKTITYKDLDGLNVIEDFYFSFSKAELAQMELETKEGMKAKIERIVASDDRFEIIEIFKYFLRASIGRKSEDNKRFMKSEEITREFVECDAYSELFMELITDARAAIEFIQGIMPADLTAQVKAAAAGKSTNENVVEQKTLDDYTDDELLELSTMDFKELEHRVKEGSNVPRRLLVAAMRRRP